ncbi:competence protein [Humibacillus sp. DSM 29435]|uniref:CinA family protein n=1 Tax=Humibacillus sp. DSM 29435 TaxID=1869167 RepID=UPI000872B1BE|nr:nicotinamide-nucleotide amidohydrolase family protein [Humibacillus sp. DSM 29435]OFE16541.1 competence protein [Humibacillus sp. DSM 29435]
MSCGKGRDASATASDLVRHLTDVGETVAVAESLTGGLVASALADVPGASAVLRGGVVAYAADLKVSLLGVPAALIERVGTVHPDVALTLADGARTRLGATWGLSTTGVAGPGPAEGKPAGTVYVAVAGPSGTAVRELWLNGSRADVRRETVNAVLRLAAQRLGVPEQSAAPSGERGGTVDLFDVRPDDLGPPAEPAGDERTEGGSHDHAATT